MRNALDFSSWQGLLSTLLGLALVSLVAVGIRLLVMQRVQQRRERQNRQINERLKTLIAAYKTLGGSFTGDLAVDPRHLRELRARAGAAQAALAQAEDVAGIAAAAPPPAGEAAGSVSERRRRIRDAVEAALADVILLGTREQVQLAAQAANDMVAGRPIETAALVASLRGFIRSVLDLEAIPDALAIPKQGPLRTAGTSGRGSGGGGSAGGGQSGRGAGGGGAGAGGGAGMGAAGMGLGLGHAAGGAHAADDDGTNR